MNSFFILYKAEIAKIISKRAVWIAMAIGLIFVFVMGLTNLSSEGHISYVKSSRDTLSKLEGTEMNDDFFADFQKEVAEELKNNPDKYKALMAYDPGTAFMNGANAIALSGVFADEKTYRTDALILSAKKGRSTICLSKIAAGVSVALFQGVIIIGFLFGIMFVFFGAEGSAGMIQNIIPSSPWNITIGQMVAIFILLAFITTCFFAFTNMLLSHLTHSAVATMATHAAILFAGLFNVPGKMGIIAKLWQLRPTMALYYGTFCNTYRYGSMNNVQASILAYGVCMVVFLSMLFVSYKNSQVESR